MRRNEFEFHFLSRVALFPFAAVSRKLHVADFVRFDDAAVGQIGDRNIERSKVLYATVRGLRLYSFHFLLIQDDFCRRSDSSLCSAYRMTACAILVYHVLTVTVFDTRNTRKGYAR